MPEPVRPCTCEVPALNKPPCPAHGKPCPFCDLDKIRRVSYHPGGVVSFEPLNPVTPGHILVVPEVHVEDALDNPVVTGRTFEMASRLARSLVGPKVGVNLITSVGPLATQTVRHLHVHVVPRREGDGLHLPWTGQVRDV